MLLFFRLCYSRNSFLKELYPILDKSKFSLSFSLGKAQARCHRIGQNKAVKVYRLITRNSYEREMFDRASLKLGLDKAVLQSMSGRENSVGGVCRFIS